jgi:hypothetical protein
MNWLFATQLRAFGLPAAGASLVLRQIATRAPWIDAIGRSKSGT